MKLTLKYFASLREALGAGGPLEWTPEAEPTAAALRAWLRAQSPAHAQALAPGRAVRVAVDQALADESVKLREGAEVAFFPPVTGG
ncbi:MAG TPA: MoaD/ThiS family protein [Burkholderiaceae bacterium]|jgi:molybdopterin synthase sulfur carrier subunit|nr:MoaD/ThiS family protein [Burkholderiaceae bacterium]